ncbi:hypothetical protein RF11_09534 [Thelohanellus kitauei]|uniref:Uncharacterized protein n=1 Tax=Thelohanellus kitauei TaxID=669202 RepID=A0A0C2ICS4_THEKT|nr:hypothetical protein RF11_09534 [Thelohanellus kitauei]
MSLDIKKIIIKLVIEERKLVSEVSRTLSIPGTTIWSFFKKYETSDPIEADKGGTRYAKITLEIENQIRQLVADNCTTTIQRIIDTKTTTFWKITKPIPEKRNDPEIKAERSMCCGINPSSFI